MPGAWDGFELAIRAVPGSRLRYRRPSALAGRLVAAYGEPLIGTGWVTPAPTYSRLRPRSPTSDSDLARHAARSRAQPRSISTAAAVADPDLFGARCDLEEAVAAPEIDTPGVGEWTAQYIALRQLREPDAFPAARISD